jgi:twinkle protein
MKTFADYGIDTKGKSSGELKTQCPQCSASRKKRGYPCLNVNLDKNVWHCWHCDWSGGLGMGEYRRPQIAFRKPDYVAKSEGLANDLTQWFAERGISDKTLRRNQIGKGVRYFPQTESETACILFPYLRGTEVVNIKSRTRDKHFRMESGCERVLYGLNDIGERLVWVEGEMDKLSVEEAGITSCVSVPDGAPAVATKNYSSKFDYMAAEELDRAKVHVIAVDNDAAGVRLKEELIRRLGRENCLVVEWPEVQKDANGVLMAFGKELVRAMIDDAQPLPIEGVYRPADFLIEVMDDYTHGPKPALSTGWAAVDEFYKVLPGEWTLVTGIPGHGKSEWLDALTINLAQQHGWRFGVYSAENMPVREHLEKLAEKVIGKPFGPGRNERMTPTEIDRAMTWLDNHYRVILPDDPTPESLIVAASGLVKQFGINGLVLDPWNEMGHHQPESQSETQYISEMLSKLRWFARNHDVHLWLVAHPRQLQRRRDSDKEPVPTPYEISGSANWNNKADNIITVWRDRLMQTQDVDIHVQKVRKKRVGTVGLATIKYDRITGRYFDPMKDSDGRVYEYSHAKVLA